jgi:hypothetical protein
MTGDSRQLYRGGGERASFAGPERLVAQGLYKEFCGDLAGGSRAAADRVEAWWTSREIGSRAPAHQGVV